jgi:arylsulfatase A-like enzyme
MNMKFLYFFLMTALLQAAEKPNIVWLCIEDASAHIGCYGETAIKTPVMDNMAREGIKFEKAYVTAPVCSSSRSAMVTGMFQMTSGFHLHRSQRTGGKGGGNKAYYKSYEVPSELLTIPELFKKAGYYTSNKTKTDYNFVRKGLYDSTKGWEGRKKGQPFFAQFQLHGGKNRKSAAGVDKSKIKIPPYYADGEVIRDDWANYLGSWVKTDKEVGGIIEALKEAGELENTYIFLWTDHGVSHIRGKQFLYEEGVHIPLIVRFPNKAKAGTVRKDLVTHIDISVTSLALAGIDIPPYLQGKSIFAEDYKEQKTVYFGRDRCDETVDVIRGLRTQKYKYIRNFLPDVSHLQPSQYKDGKKIVSHSRELFKQGKLNEIQARPFQPTRPVEELYDLSKDPHELNNLAGKPELSEELGAFRKDLKSWMTANNDMGLIPEPLLEDLGKKYGSKYAILKQAENKNLVADMINIIEAGEKSDSGAMAKGLHSERPAIRYWAAKAVGNRKVKSFMKTLQKLLGDSSASVRIAAAESLIQLGELETGANALNREINNQNLLAGMYALRSVEAMGIKLSPFVGGTVKNAVKSDYEFSKRIARRLCRLWNL